MKPLTQYCRRRLVRFWGRNHFVTPRLVDWIHGDGLQVICFEPLATRPHYYVVRVDSKINLDNRGSGRCFCDEVLGDLQDEIEDQYLKAHETWESDNGRTYTRHNAFPALDVSCGSSWGQLGTLKEPDKRSEARIRFGLQKVIFVKRLR